MTRRGFGLIEVLISVAILAIVGMGLTYFLTDIRRQSIKVENSTECLNLAESILSKIGNVGRLNIDYPYTHDSAGTDPLTPVFSQNINIPISNWISVSPLIDPGATPVLRNSQLIYSSISLLQSLYNQNRGHCTELDGVETAGLFTNGQLPDQVTSIKLKIEPILQNGNPLTPCPPRPILIRPKKENNSPPSRFQIAGRDDLSLKAKISITMDTTDGPKMCPQAESIFTHTRDASRPQPNIVFDNFTSDVGNLILTGGTWTSCGPTAGYNNVQFRARLTNFENGSVVLCRSSTSGSYSRCTETNWGGQTPIITTTRGSRELSIGFSFIGLPENQEYYIELLPIDSAGNEGTPSSMRVLIDRDRPQIAQVLVAPGELDVGPPEDGEPASAPTDDRRMPLDPPMNNKNNWAHEIVQCNQSAVSASGVVTDAILSNITECECDGGALGETNCAYDPATQTCTGDTLSTNEHGIYTYNMRARDSCDWGDFSPQPLTWASARPGEFNPRAPSARVTFLANPNLGLGIHAQDPSLPSGRNSFVVNLPDPFALTTSGGQPLNPRSFKIACDCGNINDDGAVNSTVLKCGTDHFAGMAGCSPGEFKYWAWDICGRKREVRFEWEAKGQTWSWCDTVPCSPGFTCASRFVAWDYPDESASALLPGVCSVPETNLTSTVGTINGRILMSDPNLVRSPSYAVYSCPMLRTCSGNPPRAGDCDDASENDLSSCKDTDGNDGTCEARRLDGTLLSAGDTVPCSILWNSTVPRSQYSSPRNHVCPSRGPSCLGYRDRFNPSAPCLGTGARTLRDSIQTTCNGNFGSSAACDISGCSVTTGGTNPIPNCCNGFTHQRVNSESSTCNGTWGTVLDYVCK